MSLVRRMWQRKFTKYSNDDNYHWEIKFACFAFGIGGIWPEAGKTKRIPFIISLTIIFVILTLPQIITLFSFKNEDELFSSISGIIYRSYLIVAMCVLRFNSKIGQSILDDLRANWMSDCYEKDRQIMHHYARDSRKSSVVIATAITGVAIITKFLPPLVHAIITGKSIKTIPGHRWYPFSLANPFVVAACYISEVIAINVFSVITVGIDICLIVFIFHTCGQLTILGSRIRTHHGQIRHSLGRDILRNCSCLQCIVDSHVKICNFIKKIDSYFHMVFFFRLCGSLFYFCCVGFVVARAITTKEYKELMANAVLVFSVLATLFLYGWLADMCQERSIALGDIAFSSEWMTRDPKMGRNLIFIIRHTRIPLKITAAKFFIFSLSLFKEFILKSVSYLSVLITLQQAK